MRTKMEKTIAKKTKEVKNWGFICEFGSSSRFASLEVFKDYYDMFCGVSKTPANIYLQKISKVKTGEQPPYDANNGYILFWQNDLEDLSTAGNSSPITYVAPDKSYVITYSGSKYMLSGDGIRAKVGLEP